MSGKHDATGDETQRRKKEKGTRYMKYEKKTIWNLNKYLQPSWPDGWFLH